MKPVLSFYLDARRAKRNSDKFPLKLCWYYKQRQKYLSTGIYLTVEEWDDYQLRSRLRGARKYAVLKLGLELDRILEKANEIMDEMEAYSFEVFKNRMKGKPIERDNLLYWYKFEEEHALKVRTAEIYECSRSKVEAFFKSTSFIHLRGVTQEKLEEFNEWMTGKGLAKTTRSIIMRQLQSVINTAIEEGALPANLKPFGKRRFRAPRAKNPKKSLPAEDVAGLFHYEPKPGLMEQFARDIWIFSYLCQGINPADIFRLRWDNVTRSPEGDYVSFVRHKIAGTRAGNTILAPLNEECWEIINRWSSHSRDDYVFPVLMQGLSEKRENMLIANKVSTINKNLKAIARKLGTDPKLSLNYARHTWATLARDRGLDLWVIQKGMGHGDLKTTENYFGGVDGKTLQESQQRMRVWEEVEEASAGG